jgi:serine/threonine protein kinase
MSRSPRKLKTSSVRKTKKSKLTPVDLDAAGKPIAAGGFGCVFLPRLTCDDPAIESKLKKSKTKYVSKLMLKRYANDEEEEMKKVLKIVNKLPTSSHKYFILHDTNICNPAPLSSEDKEGFDRKCINLTNKSIYSDNVNRQLKNLKSINIPFGGDEVGDLFRLLGTKIARGDKEALHDFMYANLSMIDILEKAIIPINKAGLLHHDLKGQNILIDKESLKYGKPSIKLIDWGLAIYVDSNNPKREMPPLGCRFRPFQFNLPFSVILLSQESFHSINRFCRDNNGITRANVKSIASKLIKETISNTGEGHYSYIMQILETHTLPFFNNRYKTQFLNESVCYTKGMLVQEFIIDYLSDILLTFADDKCHKTDIRLDYFPIYRHNCDIWGFLMAYQDVFDGLCLYSSNVIKKNPIAKQISNILMKYCYSSEFASKKIPVNELVRDLKEINVIGEFKDNRKGPSPVPSAPKGVNTPQSKPPMHQEKNKTKKVGKALQLKAKSPVQNGPSPNEVSLKGKKRCPKGYMKVNGTTKCRKKGTNAKMSRKIRRSPHEISLKGKRCPNGYQKNPKTGKCRSKDQ